MGRPRGWMVTLTGRPAMRSPGRPPVRRDVERGFWMKIAEGLSSEEAAIACGVSGPVGVRWFRERGGMPSIQLTPLSGRYLSFAEREDIALLRGQGLAVRAIARTLGRIDGKRVPGPEVRFIGRRHGRRADRRWATSWSPEQISNRLRLDFPEDATMRISHEAIYQALFIQGRGALKRELVACLRTGRALRVPRART